MVPPRLSRAHDMRVGVVSLFATTLTFALHAEPVAHAEPVPNTAPGPSTARAVAGSSALSRARTAWERGDFDVAEPLYKDAIEQGGLSTPELLDAYVHLGAARGVLHRKEGALAAFRRAALIDGKFTVPPEAGRKVQTLAETARREQARMGAITVRAVAPDAVQTGASFRVRASLDAVHVAVVARLGLDVRDASTGARYTTTQAASTDLTFEVPAKVTATEGTLSVTVNAFDGYENQLATNRLRVVVLPREKAEPSPLASALKPPVVTPPGAPNLDKVTASSNVVADTTTRSSGGFWSSPWPYVVGGAVLAGAGAALYMAFRPPTDVSVGPARIETSR